MFGLLLTLFGIALVFAILVVFGGRLMVNRVGSAVSRRHDETTWVLSTGIAPRHWSRRYTRLIRALDRVGAGNRLSAFVRARCKRRLERRLLGLLRYIEGSNVINDEPIRRDMASKLRQVGRAWEESSWEAVVGIEPIPPHDVMSG